MPVTSSPCNTFYFHEYYEIKRAIIYKKVDVGGFMRCFICSEEIKNEKPLEIFKANICEACVQSINEIHAEDIFYDFYRDRIKNIEKPVLHKYQNTPLTQP